MMAGTGGFWKPKEVSHRQILKEETHDNDSGSLLFPEMSGPLAQQRMLLPIRKHKRQLLYAIERHNVLVIVGETGSGKSTQVPQYLCENGWTDRGFQVVCTQPRRIAAQSLAQRVSEEMETRLGHRVGYSVRFDTVASEATEILYVTDGMLLREATLSDPLLSKYSVIMIDEAHERNLNSDALLGIVKKIRKKRPTLRVIVCSATIDAQAFLDYFVPPQKKKNNKKNKIKRDEKQNDDESDKAMASEQSTKKRNRWGDGRDKGSKEHDTPAPPSLPLPPLPLSVPPLPPPGIAPPGMLPPPPLNLLPPSLPPPPPLLQQQQQPPMPPPVQDSGVIVSVDGRQHPVDTMYLQEAAPDYVRATVETVIKIHIQEGNGGGDILAFLPSGEDIDSAIQMTQEHYDQQGDETHFPHQQGSSSSSNRNTNAAAMRNEQNKKRSRTKRKQVVCLALYGSLPYSLQQRVFQEESNNKVRRVVFSTNMAETSVTVPNITHVIDCGYAKIPYFDPKTGFERLIVSPISRASAQQRAGRAGRVRSGKCYRLYQESWFLDKMEAATPPEVLRTNLTGFVLTLKALGIQNILSFDLMDLPSVEALSHALESLYALGAIDDATELTPLGMDMAAFPTEPRVSRMLLESLERGCSWEVLSVASALQVRALLMAPRTQRQQLEYDAIMNEAWVDRTGDHVTYANLIAEADDQDWNERDCRERFVNYLALKRAVEIRNQLTRFLRRYGKVHAMGLLTDQTGDRERAIRQCVTAGFFFNVAKLANDGRYYTLRGGFLVSPSPGSILRSHGDVSEYVVFGETTDGARGGMDMRTCSTIEAKWLRELAPHYWR